MGKQSSRVGRCGLRRRDDDVALVAPQALAARPARSARTRATRRRTPACRARSRRRSGTARRSSASALKAQSSDGAAPSAPQTMPMPSSGQRCSRRMRRRSRGRRVLGQHVVGQDAVGEPAPDQRRQDEHERRHEPERNADARGRTSASSVQPSDIAALCQKPAPWRRSRSGKRRAATSRTIAGVISTATSSSDATTTTGTASATMTSGASTLAKAARPDRTQPVNSADEQSPALDRAAHAADGGFPVEVAEQRRGAADEDQRQRSTAAITRGCRQYAAARQKASNSTRVIVSSVRGAVTRQRGRQIAAKSAPTSAPMVTTSPSRAGSGHHNSTDFDAARPSATEKLAWNWTSTRRPFYAASRWRSLASAELQLLRRDPGQHTGACARGSRPNGRFVAGLRSRPASTPSLSAPPVGLLSSSGRSRRCRPAHASTSASVPPSPLAADWSLLALAAAVLMVGDRGRGRRGARRRGVHAGASSSTSTRRWS